MEKSVFALYWHRKLKLLSFGFGFVSVVFFSLGEVIEEVVMEIGLQVGGDLCCFYGIKKN